MQAGFAKAEQRSEAQRSELRDDNKTLRTEMQAGFAKAEQ